MAREVECKLEPFRSLIAHLSTLLRSYGKNPRIVRSLVEWAAWCWLWLECLMCGIPCQGCSIARILAAIENVSPRDRERFSESKRNSPYYRSKRSWNIELIVKMIDSLCNNVYILKLIVRYGL